jgi:hypothetical protein
MSIVSVNWKPSQGDLKGFRWIALTALPLIGLVLYLVKQVDWRWCMAIGVVGGVIWVSGLISYELTRMIYLALVAITLPIGLVMSFVIMALFYFGIITPLGLLFRIMGRDSMCRRFDAKAKTYWIPHESSRAAERYFQQF